MRDARVTARCECLRGVCGYVAAASRIRYSASTGHRSSTQHRRLVRFFRVISRSGAVKSFAGCAGCMAAASRGRRSAK
ncbi:hypothetical protein B0H17DRAFT_1042745, partial [Mycena rosella]